METGESGTPSKSAKAAPSQEHSNTPALYVDWATAIQAYHTAVTNPPPGYFPSSASSGLETHSYLWGGQPLMPPYGTPPPYAVYPPGGMFTHPSMPPGSIIYGQYEVTPTGSATETSTVIPIGLGEGKMIESKEKLPVRKERMRGSIDIVSRKGSEVRKVNVANVVFSQSGESATETSSDGSEEDNQVDILQNRSFEHVSAEGMQAQSSNIPVFHSQLEALGATSDGEVLGTSASQMVNASHTICSGKPATEILPITNINIGIDYWNGLTPSTITVAKGRLYSSVSAAMAPANGSSVVLGPACDGIPPGLWLQDEREMKRQRRKQSNRESARRSRLRKQAECEELAVKVDSLSAENSSLRVELNRLIELSKKLASENSSLHEQIRKAQQGSRNWHDHKNKLHSERNGIPGRDIQAGNSDSSEKIDKDHMGEKALSSLDVNYAEVVTAS